MEGEGNNQNTTASTSAPSWSNVVRGHIPSQAGVNSGLANSGLANSGSASSGSASSGSANSSSVNSSSSGEDQTVSQGIVHNNGIRLQSPATSISLTQSLENLVLGSNSEVWPSLGQGPARPRTSTSSASSSASGRASTSGSIPSSTVQDEGHRASHDVAVSQACERLCPIPRTRNEYQRPFYPRGGQTRGYVPTRRNASNRVLFPQSSERIGHVPQGTNPPNRAFFPITNNVHPMGPMYRGPGYHPQGVYGNVYNNYQQRECPPRGPPRGGYGNMHNMMHAQREYNYNWNSEPLHGINNFPVYQQVRPTNNMTQLPLPQLPLIDGVTNQLYMNAAPMSFILDAPSGVPSFMPTLHHVPGSSQYNNDLRRKIVMQVDYYFSAENLSKDWFLVRLMDESCWVDVSEIVKFNRMKRLTNNLNLILDALRDSTAVEVQGSKIRRKKDWFQWPNPDLNSGVPQQGQMDGSSSSETASELGTTDRVFPERDNPGDLLDAPKVNI